MRSSIIQDNRNYWTGRAESYSRLNRMELGSGQKSSWEVCISQEIEKHFPGRKPGSIRILEIGTGPGFFAILLAEAGYDVTAIDLTPAMLAQARKNAGSLAGRIRFLEMNAEDLMFADETFDLVLMRNLTWNLPHPRKAYKGMGRVLKAGGLILNFDANWYRYLFDEEARSAYEADREASLESCKEDRNVGENFHVMEEIARHIPLSKLDRPAWDMEVLARLGFEVSVDEGIYEKVWTGEEKINFHSTPLFLIRASKKRAPDHMEEKSLISVIGRARKHAAAAAL